MDPQGAGEVAWLQGGLLDVLMNGTVELSTSLLAADMHAVSLEESWSLQALHVRTMGAIHRACLQGSMLDMVQCLRHVRQRSHAGYCSRHVAVVAVSWPAETLLAAQCGQYEPGQITRVQLACQASEASTTPGAGGCSAHFGCIVAPCTSSASLQMPADRLSCTACCCQSAIQLSISSPRPTEWPQCSTLHKWTEADAQQLMQEQPQTDGRP